MFCRNSVQSCRGFDLVALVVGGFAVACAVEVENLEVNGVAGTAGSSEVPVSVE